MRVFSFVLFAFVVASSALATPNHFSAVPPGAELGQFPVVVAAVVPKTAKQEYELESRLGLRPTALRAPLVAFNHYRKDNSWRYEEISEGAIVFVDYAGVIRYKADCWNRLVVIEPSLVDNFLAWIGGLVSRVSGMVAEWAALLAFIGGLILGAIWGRTRVVARPVAVAPAPVHPAHQ